MLLISWNYLILGSLLSPRNDETLLGTRETDTAQQRRQSCQAPLGGSYGGLSPPSWRLSSNPPVWDVDAVFHRLQPPGNGPGKTEHNIVDIRGLVNVEFLDDWVCNGTTILVFELLPTSWTVPFTPPFTQQDALTLLDPWMPDVFQTDFTLVEDMHPVGLAFIEAAGPYDPDNLSSVAIFVDGSVQHTEEGPAYWQHTEYEVSLWLWQLSQQFHFLGHLSDHGYATL